MTRPALSFKNRTSPNEAAWKRPAANGRNTTWPVLKCRAISQPSRTTREYDVSNSALVYTPVYACESDLSLTSKAAWDQRLAITTTLVNLAPPEQQANAKVYLQLVIDRYQLVSQYHFVSVQQLPADVRNHFIATHQSQQDQSNIFIAYAKTACNVG